MGESGVNLPIKMGDGGVNPSYVLQERIQTALESYNNPKEDVNQQYTR